MPPVGSDTTVCPQVLGSHLCSLGSSYLCLGGLPAATEHPLIDLIGALRCYCWDQKHHRLSRHDKSQAQSSQVRDCRSLAGEPRRQF